MEYLGQLLTWIPASLDLARFLALVWLPGYLVARLIGANRWWGYFLAPVLGAALTPCWGIVYAQLGISFNRVTVVSGWAILILTLATARVVRAGLRQIGYRLRGQLFYRAHPGHETPHAGRWAWLGAGLIAAGIGAFPLAYGMQGAASPPQTYDAVYHLNAVRWIIETGNGSSLYLNQIAVPTTGMSFYPGAFHTVVALCAGADIVQATNTVVLAAVAIFALRVGMITHLLAPKNQWALLAGTLAGTVFVSYPTRLASYGTVWPTLWSYLWLFTYLGLLLAIYLGWGRAAGARAYLYWGAVMALVATALGHPSGLIGALYLTLIFALWALLARLRGNLPGMGRVDLALALSALLGGGALVALIARSTLMRAVANFPNPVTYPPARVPYDILVDAQFPNLGFAFLPALGTAVATIAGAWIMARARLGWWPLLWVAVAGLTMVSLTHSPLTVLAAPWYSNSVRIGALAPLIAAPLAGLGLGAALAWAGHRPRGWRRLGALTLIAAITFAGSIGLRGYDRARMIAGHYVGHPESGWSGMVTPGELAMLRGLGPKLEPGARVLGSPFQGAAYLYALAGVDPVFHTIGAYTDPDTVLLGYDIEQIDTDPRICRILRNKNIHYIYTDTVTYWPENELQISYSGLSQIDPRRLGLEAVAHGGTATIYRIPDSICAKFDSIPDSQIELPSEVRK